MTNMHDRAPGATRGTRDTSTDCTPQRKPRRETDRNTIRVRVALTVERLAAGRDDVTTPSEAQ